MKCPDCNQELQVLELNGTKLHECASCKGMWLNHGAVKDLNGFLNLLNILKIKIAIKHPRMEQVWESIESISPLK